MIPERYAPMTYALFRIVFGLLFLLFGLQKTVGILGGQLARPFSSMQGMAGIIETVCGFLIMIGLYTRPAAFIASGEMAVAYFYIHTRLMGIAPLVNMGERATMFCFAFLYICSRGAGGWSVDRGSSLKR
ncbi:MAG TPA: DoxX family protein [Vicinamibacterales bacterium]|nr:DoxX family protein [Vicinamibacterales bacterium]